MDSLETELGRARELDVGALADAIEAIGFECTRCGACCKADDCGDSSGDTETGEPTDPEPHTATVFPDEIRRLEAAGDYDFRDVARPMPYGVEETASGPQGETFEWALQTDACGDCTFYDESDGTGACTVHEDRPLICRTYPFSVALGGTSQPMGETVDSVTIDGRGDPGEEETVVRAHECEGLGRDISREDAVELAAALKERAVRELQEAIGVRENYDATDVDGVVVHDSEGQKRPDGTELGGE